MISCRNCSYGCCCICYNPECYLCKDNRCRFLTYPDHYVCFSCRRGWKMGGDKYWHDPNVPEDFPYRKLGDRNPTCSQCQQEGTVVSPTFRLPKRHDKEGWEVLQIMFQKNNFGECKKNTLGYFWNFFFGCTVHLPQEISSLIWYPSRKSECNDWLKYMSTKVVKNWPKNK